MRLLLVSIALPVTIFVIAGCTTSSGDAPSPAMYTKDLGSATAAELGRETPLILARYQYQIERVTSTKSFRTIETRWHGRYPLQDELDSGVVEARTRITVNARSRRRAAGGSSDMMVVQLTAENMVRMVDSLEWRHGFMTPMFRKYIEEIADRLKTEFQTGVRVF